jgi:hypothetical protein
MLNINSFIMNIIMNVINPDRNQVINNNYYYYELTSKLVMYEFPLQEVSHTQVS